MVTIIHKYIDRDASDLSIEEQIHKVLNDKSFWGGDLGNIYTYMGSLDLSSINKLCNQKSGDVYTVIGEGDLHCSQYDLYVEDGDNIVWVINGWDVLYKG